MIPSPILYAAAALLVSTVVPAQRNVALMSSFNPPGTTFFNDIWGYVDPNTGKEYAILLGSNGTYVVDCSNPSQPIQRGFFSYTLSGWRTSTWRDARTYGRYLYVVTEGSGSTGGHGMQIIDLQNPDNPQFVRTWDGGATWNHAHNISIDVPAGICYVCGTSGGMLVVDLRSNPANPTYMTAFTAEYVHDMQAQNGFGHLAEINRSQYEIIDVRNLPAIGRLGTASVSSCHTSVPTRDDRYCVTTSETTSSTRGYGKVRVWNVTNRNSPQFVSDYIDATATSVHNAFPVEQVVHIAHYASGYRALDISNPSSPVVVGEYDTNAATAGFDGNWGIYPFQPSGVVYCSDMDNGLFVLKPKATTTQYGAGTPGTGGAIPKIFTFGAAWIGNTNFALQVESTRPNASAFYLIATGRLNLSLGGLTLLVDTANSAGAIVSATTDAGGKHTLSLPVPNNGGLDGATMNFQALVADPNGPFGFAASAGKSFEIFVR